MRQHTIGTLFSGFGGVEVGAMAAGFAPLWAVEYDAALAAVYRQNIGEHVRVGDILDMNPVDFETPDILHASPPCPNFSQAKTGAAETAGDIALAQKVADFIAELLPPFFTLENVYMYRQSQSWAVIAQALLTHGYQFNYWRVNMADYGVPQTRQRMIVIARRDGVRPQLPPQTHAENPQPALFGGLQRWVSWHEAITDLIPDLPDSEFAPWQLERLPVRLQTGMVMTGNSNFADAGAGKGFLAIDEPANTVTAGLTGGLTGGLPRAFIMDGGNTSKAIVCRLTDAPYFTVTSGGEKNPIRAQVGGRVVQLSPRCLARLQSFPDHYQLPEDRETAARGIGNAVPPLFYRRLAESLRGSL